VSLLTHLPELTLYDVPDGQANVALFWNRQVPILSVKFCVELTRQPVTAVVPWLLTPACGFGVLPVQLPLLLSNDGQALQLLPDKSTCRLLLLVDHVFAAHCGHHVVGKLHGLDDGHLFPCPALAVVKNVHELL